MMNIDRNGIFDQLNDFNERNGEELITWKSDEPMRLHTTFRIGGPASLYVNVKSTDALREVLRIFNEASVRTFVLGRGSNVLFSDNGYDGAVVSLSMLDKISVEGETLTAQAGALVTNVAKKALESSLTGMEFLYGIPGTCGGGVFMNAGAYGGEMSSIVKESTYLDLSDYGIKKLAREDHDFGYRHSVFRKGGKVILQTSFCLKKGIMAEIGNCMKDLMKRRLSKQPLEYPSAGSIFKRCEGRFTGQMIEEAGLKGTTVGGAQISEKHAGFIINKGDATAADVLELINIVKTTVLRTHGANLECEMIYVE